MKQWPLLLALVLTGCASAGTQAMVGPSREAYEDGLLLFKAEKWDLSIQEFSEAVKLNPKNHDAFVMRGKARLRKVQKGDGSKYLTITSAAFDDFSSAISVYPRSFDAYYHRAVAFVSVSQYRNAAFDLVNHCLKLRPDDALTNRLLGEVYDRGFVDRQAHALKYYKSYVQIVGERADRLVLARIQEMEQGLSLGGAPQDDEKRAVELFEDAMDRVAAKDSAGALKLLTELSIKYGHTQVAKKNQQLLPILIKQLQAEPGDGKN